MRYDAQIMRNEDNRHPKFAPKLAKKAKDLGLDGHVQRGRRFVSYEKLGFA
ncbi:hypothetical protein GCM10010869_05210 [Mesorhizobium tianshanense]|nr:hypothetical protein GCM10010869_05210 [Mesorhizobium tianshanense]